MSLFFFFFISKFCDGIGILTANGIENENKKQTKHMLEFSG